MKNESVLSWLQNWYFSRCDLDWEKERWEHNFGVEFTTIDNPGWSVKIDLRGTNLENKVMENYQEEIDEDDWLFCTIENKKFIGTGGPKNLIKILEFFKTWAEQ